MKTTLFLIAIIVHSFTMIAQNSFTIENFSPAQNIWYTWQPNIFNHAAVDPANSNETVGYLHTSSTEQYGAVKCTIIDTIGLQNALLSGKQTLKFRMRVDNPHATEKAIRIRIYAEPNPSNPNVWGNHMYIDVTPTVVGEWAQYSFDLASQYSSNLLYNRILIEPSPNVAWNESVYIDDIQLTLPNPTFEIVRAYTSTDGTQIIARFNQSFEPFTNFSELSYSLDGAPITIESFEISPNDDKTLIAQISQAVTSDKILQLSYTTGTLRSGLLLPLQNFEITIANLVNITTITGWRDDFNSDSDAITQNISILPTAATSHGEVTSGDGYYSVTFNGAIRWEPLLITTISDVPEESKNVIDLSGQEFIKLRYRIAPNAISTKCMLRVDLKDKTHERTSDQNHFIELPISTEWNEIIIDLHKGLYSEYGIPAGKVDQGTIYQAALYFAENEGNLASNFTPTLFKGTIEFDYIELGGEVPAPVIENITESELYGGSSYTLEVTDSINGGLITWYSDAELTNIVGYGNSLTTTLLFKGDDIRYATRTIANKQSISTQFRVFACIVPQGFGTNYITVPNYKKDIILTTITIEDIPLRNTLWKMSNNDDVLGETFTYPIDKADTTYHIGLYIMGPSWSSCPPYLSVMYIVTITNELPFVNTTDTVIHIAIGEEKDLVFKNNNQYMCNTWNSSPKNSHAIDTVAIDYFPNLFIIDQESEYTIVTIKGMQDGVDTLEWYRTTNCTPDGTVKRFVVAVGNGSIDTCPKIEFTKLEYSICEPTNTLSNKLLSYGITQNLQDVFVVDTIYPRGQVLSIGKQNARMYVVFNNGCSVHVEDSITITQYAKPSTPIVENYMFEIPQAQLLQAVLADNCTGQWISTNNDFQYYQDSKKLWLETDHAIGEYVHAVVAIDTNTLCVSDTAFSYVKVVSSSMPSISGTVYVGDQAFSDATIQLFKKVNNTYVAEKLTTVSKSGHFSFSYLEPATYILRAIPQTEFSISSSLYLPTFYYSTTNWEQAFEISLQGKVEGIDLQLIEYTPVSNGNSEISGNVLNNDNTAGYNELYKEFIYFNVPVYVLQNGKIVGYAVTDIDGNYTISNLPKGTYQVYIDIPGYTYTKEIVYLPEDAKAEVNFIVKNGEIALDIDTPYTMVQTKVYPNPAIDYITISSTQLPLQVTVFDILGNIVLTATNTQTLDVSVLPQAVYTIQIKSAASIETLPFVKQ